MRGVFKRKEPNDLIQTPHQIAHGMTPSEALQPLEVVDEVVDEVVVQVPDRKPAKLLSDVPRVAQQLSPDVTFPRTDKEIAVHSLVRASGLPNFQGCRIPVFSKFNTQYLRQMGVDYVDKEIIEFLEFGFPISFHGSNPDRTSCTNHRRGGGERFFL